MRGKPPLRRAVGAGIARASVAVALASAVLTWSPAAACASNPQSIAPPHTSGTALRFVAFGDSLTAGYKTPGPSWPARVASMRSDLQLVHNAGVTGDTTGQLLARIDRDVYAYRPDLLTIFVGLNDLSHCKPVGQVVANIRAMVAGAQEHDVGRIVLILNSHTIGWSSGNGHGCGPQLQANIDLLDDALIEYGIAAGIQTIDLRPAMDTNGHYTKAFLVPDCVHYNDAGAARVSAVVSAQLSAGFNRRLRGPR